ncbi:hypothetical protein BDZ85DRAFT_91421 [Elsinoe ampelina]|uniref:Uncharacterized protein n=1 Tax=Elsinoe ampelina TaxID=302913 RepID=A0A6A6GHT6_9PEZI|nr:hypothetical protein BDZ85DRAFT_91421 [Elsinoe ampelina]
MWTCAICCGLDSSDPYESSYAPAVLCEPSNIKRYISKLSVHSSSAANSDSYCFIIENLQSYISPVVVTVWCSPSLPPIYNTLSTTKHTQYYQTHTVVLPDIQHHTTRAQTSYYQKPSTILPETKHRPTRGPPLYCLRERDPLFQASMSPSLISVLVSRGLSSLRLTSTTLSGRRMLASMYRTPISYQMPTVARRTPFTFTYETPICFRMPTVSPGRACIMTQHFHRYIEVSKQRASQTRWWGTAGAAFMTKRLSRSMIGVPERPFLAAQCFRQCSRPFSSSSNQKSHLIHTMRRVTHTPRLVDYLSRHLPRTSKVTTTPYTQARHYRRRGLARGRSVRPRPVRRWRWYHTVIEFVLLTLGVGIIPLVVRGLDRLYIRDMPPQYKPLPQRPECSRAAEQRERERYRELKKEVWMTDEERREGDERRRQEEERRRVADLLQPMQVGYWWTVSCW